MAVIEGTAVASGPELVQRVRAIAPLIAAHARRADDERHLTREMVDAFTGTGVIRTLVPERWGGYGLGLSEAIDVTIEAAKPSGSMGWVGSFWVDHPHWAGFFPEQAQAELWADTPDTRIAAAFVPAGRLQVGDGGWRLTGEWPWSSGAGDSEWMIVGALRLQDEAAPEHRLCLVHREQMRVVDTWYSAGMRGTGSDNVVVEDVLVPEHRTVGMADIREGTTPGAEVNPDPIFQAPLMAHAGWAMVAPAIGIAQGVMDAWVERARTKVHSYTKQQLADALPMQVRLAESDALVRGAELLLRKRIAKVESGEPITLEDRVLARRDISFASTLVKQAVDGLMQMGGAGALRDDSPIQRGWRDVQAIACHVILNFNAAGENYGRMEMGAPLNPRDPFF